MKSLVATTLFLLAVQASADGQFEINQLCVGTGCFAGDAPGFPVTISQSGSYRLTSNLNVPLGFNGIQVDSIARNVSIDFSGFALIGPAQCTGEIPTCSPPGTGNGLAGPSPGNISIFNGAIRGFPDNGVIFSSANLSIKDMRISENGDAGIDLINEGLIDSVIVSDNGGRGAFTNGTTLISNSVFSNNGAHGVRFGICRGNTFNSNGGINPGSIPEEDCTADDGTNYCNGTLCP